MGVLDGLVIWDLVLRSYIVDVWVKKDMSNKLNQGWGEDVDEGEWYNIVMGAIRHCYNSNMADVGALWLTVERHTV